MTKNQENLPAIANSIRDLFNKSGVKSQLMAALPQQTSLSPDRLVRVALTVIRTNPALLECSQQSLLACLMGCAQLGLMPEPYLGQAYLVPFWNNKTNPRTREAQLIPGYRGYITLARNSGELDTISADVVRENDEFKITKGLNENLEHVPCFDGNPGDVIGAYTVFRYMHGSSTFDFMPKAEIEKIRKRSKASDKGPWVTDYPEMCKKTVIRRHMKLAPLSIEDNTLARAAQAENMFLEGQSQSDFFLPPADDAPIEIQGGDSEGPNVEDKAKEFDETVWQQVDGYKSKFLELSATNNGMSITEVKAKAMENVKAFLGAFEKWKTKQGSEKSQQDQEQVAADPVDEFRKEWGRMRKGDRKKTGYHVYVVKNPDRIKYFCAENDPLLREMVDKYANLYGENWPLDSNFNLIDRAAAFNETESTGEGENTESRGSQDGSESISMTELMQTDEWQELSMLQEKYPDVYKSVTQGRPAPKTVRDVTEIISTIDGKVKKLNGDIPW